LDGRTLGAIDLILAIFRLAVADYLGLAYGHDAVGRPRAVRPRYRAHADQSSASSAVPAVSSDDDVNVAVGALVAVLGGEQEMKGGGTQALR
jgi:hypothetical protein